LGDSDNFCTFAPMFVRKKKNGTGTISVVVVDKSSGSFKEIKNFGVVNSEEEANALCADAHEWISTYGGQQVLDFGKTEVQERELEETARAFANIDSVFMNAPQLILDPIYDSIGFNRIPDDILRHLVIARICQPMSKLATVDYLKSHFDEDYSLDKIYYYMDKLYNTQQELVQDISVEHTRRILGGRIGIVFYDCTTIYFESFIRDDMCEPGFSKDGKTKENQVVIGLLVSAGGYPLAYSVFCGSQYEGFTMIPMVDDFVKRFNLTDYVVVADSGLMTRKNLMLLQKGNYKYILGARIRNEAKDVREWILSQEKKKDVFYEFAKSYAIPCTNSDGSVSTLTVNERLIVTYSEERAKKDADNRKRGVERLRKTFASGKIKKESLNRRGYNKFLEITKDVGIAINEEKVADDAKWDGWKGYITNTELEAKDVVSQYRGLWVVERAFRITKGNLEVRPVFHFTHRRIEAHICICFIAYKVYKELERIMKLMKFPLSVDKALEIAKTIPTVTIRMPHNKKTQTQTLFLSEEPRELKPLFDLKNFFG